MAYILNLIGFGAKGPNTNIPAFDDLIVVDGKPNGALETVNSLLKRVEGSSTVSFLQLQTMQGIVANTKLESTHPLSQKLDAAIKNTSKKIWVPSKPGDALDMARVKQGVVVAPQSSLESTLTPIIIPKLDPIPTVFNQDNLEIEYVKQYVMTYGADLISINLTSVSDELLAIIADKCLNIKEFNYTLRPDKAQVNLSNKGLVLIASLPQLEKLTLSYWDAFYPTYSGLSKLLSDPRLHLRELTVNTYLFDDKCFGIIAGYKNGLEKLNVTSASLSNKGLQILVQAKAFQSNLKSLCIKQGANWGELFSDAALIGIAQCTNLQELRLEGQFTATSQSLETVLGNAKNLKKLAVNGTPISSIAAGLIAKLPLEELDVADCSQLQQPDYENLWASQELSMLGIANCTYLQDLTKVSSLPKLAHLNLDLTTIEILETIVPIFQSKMMQKHLLSFYLKGYKYSSNVELAGVGHLTALQTLRIENVANWNDKTWTLFTSSPLAKTLETLEINRVFISDVTAPLWTGLSSLKNLMFANCNAVSSNGINIILQTPAFQTNLRKLSLYNVDEGDAKTAIPILSKLISLEVFMVGDSNLPFPKFFHLANLNRRNGVVVTYAGVITPYEQFISAI